MSYLFTVVTVGSLLSLSITASAISPEEQAKMLVVRVIGTGENGAGLIFSKEGQQVYIATAKHLLARGGNVDSPAVEFYLGRGVRADAVIERIHGDLDLAVLRVRMPAQISERLLFGELGDSEQAGKGTQVFPVGHPTIDEQWYTPVQPVFLRGSRGGMLAFESLIGKTTGFSGGGLFDSRWRPIGIIVNDSPPEMLALPISTVITQLQKWHYSVDFSPMRTAPERETTITGGFGNMIYSVPENWIETRPSDDTIVLVNSRTPAMRIIIAPSKPLVSSFEEMFNDEVHSLNAVKFRTSVKMFDTGEGFHARFIEGTVNLNVGGLTNPQIEPLDFLYMACDPVGKYESFMYISDHYTYEYGKNVLNTFIESVHYRNALEANRRR